MEYKEDKKDIKYKSYVLYLRFLCSGSKVVCSVLYIVCCKFIKKLLK